jgi:hypothetical protein
MPRVKLIRHGLDEHGDDHWGFPIYPWGQCPHPRWALRADPRFAVPIWCYCRACGQAMIPPSHGLTPEQIAETHAEADRLWADLQPNEEGSGSGQGNDEP